MRSLNQAFCLILLPVTLLATTIHVPSDQPTIQAGIDAATEGDTVSIASGTYFESQITLSSGVVVISDAYDPQSVTIDGQGMQVIVGDGLASSTVLGGVSIVGGSGEYGGGAHFSTSSIQILNCRFQGNNSSLYGGGLYFSGVSSPLLDSCEIVGNTSAFRGGGVFCWTGCLLEVRDCDFVGNSAEGAGGLQFHFEETVASVSGCVFHSNSATERGGAVRCTGGASPEFIDCLFEENFAGEGGALFCLDNSNANLTDCDFIRNRANEFGGVLCENASPEFLRCTFSQNSAEGRGSAGGMSIVSSSPSLEHCTFIGNVGTDKGGAVYITYESSPVFRNCTFWGNSAWNGGAICLRHEGAYVELHECILWGNSPSEISYYGSGPSDLTTCSDIQGGWPGEGNIDLDPLFCDPEMGDFSLRNDSPCAPDNNDCGVLIGAWPVGCSTSVENATWSVVKPLY